MLFANKLNQQSDNSCCESRLMLASASFTRRGFSSDGIQSLISSQLDQLTSNPGQRSSTSVVQNINGQVSRFQFSPEQFQDFAAASFEDLFSGFRLPQPGSPAATAQPSGSITSSQQFSNDVSEATDLIVPSSDQASLAAPAQTSSSSEAAQFMGLINDFRQANGKAPLTLNSQLNSLAAEHNQTQIAQGRISHDGFETGRSSAALRSVDRSSTAAENVAFNRGFGDPVGQAFQQLIDSPGHRRNILADYPAGMSGVAIDTTPDGRSYFTQLFVG
jgi:uncharacterized protein YkwD